MRYIDLFGGVKPHLLIIAKNNLGAEVHIDYAPSTKFYLADRTMVSPGARGFRFRFMSLKES